MTAHEKANGALIGLYNLLEAERVARVNGLKISNRLRHARRSLHAMVSEYIERLPGNEETFPLNEAVRVLFPAGAVTVMRVPSGFAVGLMDGGLSTPAPLGEAAEPEPVPDAGPGAPDDLCRVLRLLALKAHANSRGKGFWNFRDEFRQAFPARVPEFETMWKLSRMALIVSEVSEAVEGIRKPGPDAHIPPFSSEAVELADALIRIFDYAGGHGIDLGPVVLAKMAFNEGRPQMHGGKHA